MNRLIRTTVLTLLSVPLLHCSAARLVSRPVAIPPDPKEARWVVIEPLFEDADWQEKTLVETLHNMGGLSPFSGMSPYGGGFGGYNDDYPTDVQVYRRVSEKPAYAQVPALAEEQRRIIQEVHRLRPSWQVLSTGDLPAVTGPVTVVRTILGPNDVVGSNRALKSLCFGFGLVIWPLLIYDFWPVDESLRVQGTLQRIDADAADVRARLLRYPTQPDFAVDARGLPTRSGNFAIEIEYEEGLFANEQQRPPAIIRGVAEQLAGEVVKLIEAPPAVPPMPAPRPTG